MGIPPLEIYEQVPLPLIHYFEHCYYIKNGKTCKYVDPEMQAKYMVVTDPMLAIDRLLS